jgi:hypothetical protein
MLVQRLDLNFLKRMEESNIYIYIYIFCCSRGRVFTSQKVSETPRESNTIRPMEECEICSLNLQYTSWKTAIVGPFLALTKFAHAIHVELTTTFTTYQTTDHTLN